nr:uncharacterized protein LOC111516130 [Leptinotarsa decemlineata]
MSERRFKVSKSEESNNYKYSDCSGDERVTEKLLPCSDNGLTLDTGKTVMKKWANIRDSFRRSERMYKTSLKSGNARQPPKTYIFAQQLQFLKKTTAGRSIDDSFAVVADTEDTGSGADTTLQESESQNDALAIGSAPKIAETSRLKKPDPLFKKKKKTKPNGTGTHQLTIKEKSNRHFSFFKGITPTLETFDDDKVVEFQLEVMQIISEMKKNKKNYNVNQVTQNNTESEPGSSCSSQHHQYHGLEPMNQEGTANYYERPGQEHIGIYSCSPADSEYYTESSSMDSYDFS